MLPTVSIVIPTLNVAGMLEDCLVSIARQTYPKEKMEIIVADAGSTDETLETAKRHRVTRIVANPLKTGEAGKAVGVREARHEIIALIDSDNILPDPQWLARMTAPFEDSEIVASEPWEYTYRKTDGYITRYCAMLGMNDPLCLFLGNYDRKCLLTGQWTERPRLLEEDRGDYLKVKFDPLEVPTIGANGFCIRRSALEGVKHEDYLFDVDVLVEMFPKVAVAKVKIGIVHIYTKNFGGFLRKQRRRIHDFGQYGQVQRRAYPWKRMLFPGGLWFGISCITVLPLLWQSAKGYLRSFDSAWWFHPVACWATLWVYGAGVLRKTITSLWLKMR